MGLVYDVIPFDVNLSTQLVCFEEAPDSAAIILCTQCSYIVNQTLQNCAVPFDPLNRTGTIVDLTLY